MKKLTPQQVSFIREITIEYPVSYAALARLFNVSQPAVKYHLPHNRQRPSKSKGIHPISRSAVAYAWQWYQKKETLIGVGCIFKPGVDKAILSEGCRAWLEDNVGWHSLNWISKRLKCNRPAVLYMVKCAQLSDQAFQYSCSGVQRKISASRDFHIPLEKLTDLCRSKHLRWYWEGKSRGRSMIILPHDAEWLIENYTPNMIIPKRPGGSRYC